MEFFRHEYWSGVPFPTPGDILEQGIKPASPALVGGSLPLAPLGKPCFPGQEASNVDPASLPPTTVLKCKSTQSSPGRKKAVSSFLPHLESVFC